MYKFIYILPIPTEFEEFAFSIIASAFDYWEIWLYNHETKDTEIGDSKLFLLKKKYQGMSRYRYEDNLFQYHLTIQCIRTDNASAHLPSAGNCPKEKACVEEVSAFLWPLLHFLLYMDATPGRQAPLPLTGTVCNLVLGIKNIPQKNHTTPLRTTDQQLLPVLVSVLLLSECKVLSMKEIDN